jgi:hypothetical protein
MKIVELKIQEGGLAGVDTISLVAEPAIETDFYAFAKADIRYDDYPNSVKEAAAMGIKRNEAIDNKCATLVGKQRAQQLANGENLSLDTVKRMRSFLIRQKNNYDLAVSRKDYNACGYISYLLWGGPSGIGWAEKKLREAGEKFNDALVINEIDNDYSFHQVEELVLNHIFDLEVGTLPAYVNEQKKIIGPLMTPSKLIKRIDPDTDEEYFVFFTEDTIKQIAEKFMKGGDIHSVDIEHDEQKVEGVSLIETWLKEGDDDKSNLYGYDLPKGTWFGTFKIDNEEIWNKIKAKEIKGFSVAGLFVEVETT